MDGTIEHKTFAPGYAEFSAEAEDELVTVAIAVPIDAGTDAAVSDAALELTELSRDLFDHPDDPDAAAAVTDTADALAELAVPPLLADELSAASSAVTDAGDSSELQSAAVQALHAALDVQLLDAEVKDVDSVGSTRGRGRRFSMPRPRMGPRCWAMPRRWRRSLPGRTSTRRRVRRSRRCERRRISATSRLRPRRRCCCCRPRRPRGPKSRGPDRPGPGPAQGGR